jgi:excisionase family DNA binding protein
MSPACEVYTVAEIAAKLGVHRQTVHAWERDGKIKLCRSGGRTWLPKAVVEKIVQHGLAPHRIETP